MTISVANLKLARNDLATAEYDVKQADKAGLHQGLRVEVTRGRKVPVGTIGTLMGWGESQYGHWVRIQTEDGLTFCNERNVTFPELDAQRKAAYDRLEDARNNFRARLDQAKAYTGLDLSKPFPGGKNSQHSYSDTYVADYFVNPEASDELVTLMVSLLDPPGSSWGALRWSGGSSVVHRLAPDRVTICSTTCLCD
jgi:hypothetical protein